MAPSARSVLVRSSLPLLLVCGCSKPAAPAKPPVAAPPVLTQVAEPAPELSPVSTPTSLVALGRVTRPLSLANTFAGWLALPFDPKMIDALEPGLSDAIALDAPIEFAVALPSGDLSHVEPSMVVSFGVSSTKNAKTLLENYNGSALEEKSPGVWVSAEDARANCAVAASVGKATTRLVCGNAAHSLTELLPYATRGLPLENLGGSDFRAEIRAEALQQRFAAAARMGKTLAIPAILKAVALDDPRFDRPLADVSHAIGDELLDTFQDIERFTLDLNAQTNPEQVTAKVGVAYKSHKSLMATFTGAAKERMIAPPPTFFDLPATVTRAEYFAPVDVKLLERPRALSTAIVDGFLSHLEVNAALRREVTNAIDGVLSQGSSAVMGITPVSSVASKAKLTDGEALSSFIGCYVMGVDGPAAPYKTALKAWVRLDNDRAFKKGIDKVMSEKLNEAASTPDPDQAPSAKKAKAAKKQKPFSELLKLNSKPIKGLPAGSEVATLVFEAKAAESVISDVQKNRQRRSTMPKTELKTISLYFAVVPDGSRTWLLITADEKTLVEQAKAVVTGSSAPRLSTRSDVAQLRGQNAIRAGFMSLVNLKGYLAFALQAKEKPGNDAETLFSTLPHHGTTPVFYRTIATGDAQHPAIESTITLPRAIFDDVAASVPALMMSF